jgi:peptide/nickel transport system substrate-binding protein
MDPGSSGVSCHVINELAPTRSRRRRLAVAAAITCAAALGAATMPAAAGAVPSAGTAGHASAPTPTGTVSWAESPLGGPNYIFPINSCCFSVANISDFQMLMYRPLYWFGSKGTPTLDTAESLASPPTYNGQNVVVNLKPNLVWSDGESVDATDVVFFMNMLKTVARADWGDYAPGYFPDNVTAVTATGPDQVTFKVKGAVNPIWFTDNELSQITPLPTAWDISKTGAKAGSGGCSSVVYSTIVVTSTPSQPIVPVSASAKACFTVYKYVADPFNGQAADAATYATNPLWAVVDGPWKLSSYDATTENADFVPNISYQGPQKPYFAHFDEVSFNSDAAEYAALEAGTVQVGYLPLHYAPPNTGSPTTPGPNAAPLVGKYNLALAYPYQISYFPLNFKNPVDGPIFSQQYVRAAMQSLINQGAMVKTIFSGYGVATTGPVPDYPATYATKFQLANPYPYSPTKAITLLRSHGWKVVPHGTTTCVKAGTSAGECGAGIKAGTPLKLTLTWATGVDTTAREVAMIEADSELAGIHVAGKPEPFSNVISTAGVSCLELGDCSSWEAADWGGGWFFVPDILPTGEPLFDGVPGCSKASQVAVSNAGSYCDATNHKNVLATVTSTSAGLGALDTYENYLAQQVPVLWQPTVPTLDEIAVGLTGVTPANVEDNINPEYWKP